MSFSLLGIQEIGVYIPEQRESNFAKQELLKMDEQFIRNKLGVEQVSRKLDEEETSDMCVKAFHTLQQQCGITAQAIDCLVVVTQNPDGEGVPHTSAIVHGKLGCATHCAAFDIALACSGYVYALSIIIAFMQQNQMKNGLLFTADPYSKILDPTSRDTVTLFGDAATVTLISDHPRFYPLTFSFGTDGSKSHAAGVTNQRFEMNGRAIFDFAARTVPQEISQLLERQNLPFEQVDLFLLHQGSKAILDTIRRKLPVEEHKIPLGLQMQGNTVSSSIPLLLAPTLMQPTIHTMVLCGFGVGLSWACTILQRH